MPTAVKAPLIFIFCQGLPILTSLLVGAMFGIPMGMNGFLVFGLAFGLVFGSAAAGFTIYNLGTFFGWVEMVIDTTWSLPNTVLGFFVSFFYLIWGTPSRELSVDRGWIVVMPREGVTLNFLQTIGPYNLGGEGSSERFRLLMSRAVGFLYLPIYLFDFVLNFVVQILWIIALKWIYLLIFGVKSNKVYLEAPEGYWCKIPFIAWILYATLFETWIEEQKGSVNP